MQRAAWWPRDGSESPHGALAPGSRNHGSRSTGGRPWPNVTLEFAGRAGSGSRCQRVSDVAREQPRPAHAGAAGCGAKISAQRVSAHQLCAALVNKELKAARERPGKMGGGKSATCAGHKHDCVHHHGAEWRRRRRQTAGSDDIADSLEQSLTAVLRAALYSPPSSTERHSHRDRRRDNGRCARESTRAATLGRLLSPA